MYFILIFISIIIGINCIPYLTKSTFPKLEKLIVQISNYSLIAILACIISLFFNYRLKGTYTSIIITIIFILSNLFLFGLAKNTLIKLLRVIFVTILIVFSLYSFCLLHDIYTLKINENYTIKTRVGGFLSCGDKVEILKSKWGLFDKIIFIDTSLCLSGINKIEILDFNEKKAKFLIYHDQKKDSENPYTYNVEF